MKIINTRNELIEFARALRVRPDWHEPDEQGLTAEVRGTPYNFDNAMSPGEWYGHPEPDHAELHVVFRSDDYEHGERIPGQELAVVNLATLCAWATGHEVPTPTQQNRDDLAEKVHRLGTDVADAAASEKPSMAGLVVADIVRRVTDEIVRMIKAEK